MICRKEWDPPFWPVDGFDVGLFFFFLGRKRERKRRLCFVNGYLRSDCRIALFSVLLPNS